MSTTSRRAARAVAALAVGGLALAGVLWGPQSASAVAAPVLAEGSSASNASNFKNATATCPGNNRVYGASFIVVDGLGRVAVNTLQPSSDLRSVFVEAAEVASVTTNWRVIAQAICGPAVAGLQRVAATTSDAPVANKQVKASCAGGQKAYGGGFVFTNGYGEILLNQMLVAPGSASVASGVTVRGDVDDTVPSSWAVTAYAVCGAASPNYQVKTDDDYLFDSATPKTEQISCPPGTKVHGTGLIRAGALTDVLTEDLDVTAALAGVQAKAYENDATTDQWAVVPQAVCAS